VSERGLLFGTAADAYERHRLGYPDAVTDLTLAYAHPPVRRALEVGSGTGKATRLFAGRGITVTACEPDPAMAAVLHRTTAGLPVEVVVSTFEAFPLDGEPFDLLLSASAWHWTDPSSRWDRAAALLRHGGTVALAAIDGGGAGLADPSLQEAVASERRRVLPDETHATEARDRAGMWWPGSELQADIRFGDVEQHDLPRVVPRTRAEHLALLGTLSTYLQLPEDARARLLTRIGERLPDEVDVDATVRLHLARRV
jgi:SAM-dependent methyltransferase